MLRVFGAGRGAVSEGGGGGGGDRGGGGGRTKQPGELRIQKEVSELELPLCCRVVFDDPNNLLSFVAVITPEEGFWKKASYRFSFVVPPNYPHDPPKVKCSPKIFHPNIDLEGNVCLNILREDWRPVLSVATVVLGLLHLLLEPNPNDPLNHDAAWLLRQDENEFGRQVANSLRGRSVGAVQFDPNAVMVSR
eukprot:GHVS01087631.1.p1 GENE.GHVS01087631.1~~GHVS01087631.1.p1  ORF type:complete len:192 (-),score=37.91 GHVS01087631.1:105-680(-)